MKEKGQAETKYESLSEIGASKNRITLSVGLVISVSNTPSIIAIGTDIQNICYGCYWETILDMAILCNHYKLCI